MKHIETDGQLHLSAFRKISIGNWRHSRDPQTYSQAELNIEPALKFLTENKKEIPLSLTHYIAKILGDCFAHQPELNSVLLRGKLHHRKEISTFITTLLKTKKGADLSGFSIRNVDKLSLNEIAQICEIEVNKLRQGDDPEFRELEKILNRVPVFLLTPLFLFMDFVKYTLNYASKAPGMQQDRFGSITITNIGALGMQSAFTPLTPCARTPFLAAVGKPYEGVVALNGIPTVQKCIKIGFTFDHRYIDGYHGAKLLRRFTKIFENPEQHLKIFTPEDVQE